MQSVQSPHSLLLRNRITTLLRTIIAPQKCYSKRFYIMHRDTLCDIITQQSYLVNYRGKHLPPRTTFKSPDLGPSSPDLGPSSTSSWCDSTQVNTRFSTNNYPVFVSPLLTSVWYLQTQTTPQEPAARDGLHCPPLKAFKASRLDFNPLFWNWSAFILKWKQHIRRCIYPSLKCERMKGFYITLVPSIKPNK